MKPVAICRYAPHEGPGYFATYLSAHEIPWRLVKLDECDILPKAHTISGLAMMGGPMSVNDDLPWIEPMMELVRRTIDAGTPVIGHCLGGQLLSKALGGSVKENAVREIGWGEVDIVDPRTAAEWGPTGSFLSYHWHGETFSIPHGAERIWSSAHCENQAFAFGNSLGMQCHIEMTAELIETWCATGAREIEEHLERSPAVQSTAQMQEGLDAKIRMLRAVADRVYGRWIEGLTRI